MPYSLLSGRKEVPNGDPFSRCLVIWPKGIGTGGIEPPTPSASRKCSPTELRACKPIKPALASLLPTNFPLRCQGKSAVLGFAYYLDGYSGTHLATKIH